MQLPDEMAYGECYGPAMKITERGEADAYLAALVERNLRPPAADGTERTRREAEAIERSNLGYFSGYYDTETRRRVEQVFGAVHPIFGPVDASRVTTPAETFRLGVEMGKRMRRSRIAE